MASKETKRRIWQIIIATLVTILSAIGGEVTGVTNFIQ